MKRTAALLCAAFLAFLCFACGKAPKEPVPGPEKSVPLLTLYTDTQPMRIVTQEKGVKVTLQMLEYEPTVGFFRPIADEWEETLEPGKEYELPVVPTAGMPEYRLFIQQGDMIANYLLTSGGDEVFEIEGKPWSPAPIDADSPMVHLARTAAIVPPGDDEYTYWYAVANAIATLRAVDQELEPDELDEEGSWYRIPEWLFEAYALALFPGTDIPPLGDYGLWVTYHPETHERWWVGLAYSTWLWAEYKSAKQNADGTWDVTFALRAEDDDESVDRVIQLAPNGSYNPGSPFEYHIVGWPEFDYGDEPVDPVTPPPEYVVGTWMASLDRYTVCYLEIYPDGAVGLYKGDAESDQLYETYNGLVSYEPGNVSEIYTFMDMDFRLSWHIYEGEGELNLPETFQGTYGFYDEWEGYQHVLYVKAMAGADPLYGKTELKMLWVPKTEGGGSMVDVEAMG